MFVLYSELAISPKTPAEVHGGGAVRQARKRRKRQRIHKIRACYRTPMREGAQEIAYTFISFFPVKRRAARWIGMEGVITVKIKKETRGISSPGPDGYRHAQHDVARHSFTE